VLETCHFGDVRIADLDLPNTVAPIRSSRTRTTLRIAQQALSYIY
jgi:hypothetical protein